MKKKVTLLIALAVVFLCRATVHAEDYSISQTKTTINVGDIIDLDISGTDKVPVWASYNPNIATVNAKGEVKGLKAGKTIIRVRAGLKYKTCDVTVVATSIKLNKADITLYHGGTPENAIQLKATTKGMTKNVVWESSDTSIAVVDNNGKVSTVSTGEAVITATANGVSANCNVTVRESSIALNYERIQIGVKGVGSSIKVIPTVIGPNKSVKWVSSNPSVAAVSGGKITGKSAGSATVTATANGVSATCEVIVKNGLAIDEEKVMLTPSATKVLKTNAAKTDTVVWSSSDTNVVTVSANGAVNAVSAGVAIVTASCNGSNDTCIVKVNEVSTNIVEDTVYLKTRGNKTYEVSYEIYGKDTKAKWSVADKNVAAVSGGKITAKKAGTTTVTATANGKSDTVNVIVENFNPSIKLNQQQYTLYTTKSGKPKGNTGTLKATVDGISKVVTWKSSDTNVVTVNKGKITAVNAGTAVIEATANGVTAACNVTVLETEVDLSSTQLNIYVGESTSILADVTGLTSAVKWASTNSKIATVKNGVITAKKTGETDIKATANGVTSVCHVIVAEKCNHEYDNGVPRRASTCVSVGSVVYTCKLCGSNYNEPSNIVAHKYHSVVTSPTCEEAGYTAYTCSVCGDSYTDSETSPLGHKYSETVVPATCSALGKVIKTCEDCGKSTSEDIAMTDHSYSDWKVVTAATDKTEGKRQRICEQCGNTDEETIPVLPEGHVHDYKENSKAATCEEDGYTEYSCSCGDSYMETISAAGHTTGDWTVTAQATCSSAGKEEVKCETCGKVLNSRDIPTKEHTLGKWTVITDATCSGDGLKTISCTVCGQTIQSEAIPQLAHTEGNWKVVIQASCAKEGMEAVSCTVCKQVIDSRSIPVTEHTSGDWTVTKKANCVEAGEEAIKCTACGTTLDSRVIPISGHDGEWQTTIQATCGQAGQETLICSGCGITIDTRTVPVTEHAYRVMSSQNPNCTVSGESTSVCSYCGDTKTETLEPLGHVLGEPIEVVEPTCSSGGYTMYRCTRCYDDVIMDVTEKLEHVKSEWGLIREANCVSKETYGIVCLLCSEIFESETTGDYGDHVDEVESVVEPTDCHKGWTNYRCKYCRRRETRDYVSSTGSGQCDYDYEGDVSTFQIYGTDSNGNTQYKVPCKKCQSSTVCTLAQIEICKNAKINDQKALEKARQVISEIITDDMTDVEKIYEVNRWICLNCEYDSKTATNVMAGEGFSIYDDVTQPRGVILNGLAVCTGYSSAFKLFMDELGIECKMPRSSMMNHRWNQVKLDDGWYWIDVTFNDTENRDGFWFMNYFLRTDQRVYKYVAVTDEQNGEVCNGTKHLKGASMLTKYPVESADDINEMYKLQKDNAVIILSDGNNVSATSKALQAMAKEYKAQYGKALCTAGPKAGDPLQYNVIKNDETVKEFFENRIAAAESKDEEINNAVAKSEDTTEDVETETSEEVSAEVDNTEIVEVSEDVETEMVEEELAENAVSEVSADLDVIDTEQTEEISDEETANC